MKAVGHFDVKGRIFSDGKLLTSLYRVPLLLTFESVFTSASDALHDLGLCGVEGQSCRQDHPNAFFFTRRGFKRVGDAAPIKVNIGLGR